MSNTSIHIIENGTINPVFIKANCYILKKFNAEFKKNTVFERLHLLEELWVDEFNALLIEDVKITCDLKKWSSIQFSTELEKTLFLLRWS